jgi:RNA polymerase sigma factor (TIGR02999 family)
MFHEYRADEAEEAEELGEITVFLREWERGREEAIDELLPLVYSRLRMVARACMRRQRPGHTLQSTALVAELYLKIAGSGPSRFNDREHFYSFCARTMRWILSDHTKKSLAAKRDVSLRIPLTADFPWLGRCPGDTLDLDRALDSLAQLDARMAQVIEMRVYLGFTAEETAEIIRVSKPTVDRTLTMARAWLCRALRPEA